MAWFPILLSIIWYNLYRYYIFLWLKLFFRRLFSSYCIRKLCLCLQTLLSNRKHSILDEFSWKTINQKRKDGDVDSQPSLWPRDHLTFLSQIFSKNINSPIYTSSMSSSNHSPQNILNLSLKGLAVNPRNVFNAPKVTWNGEVTWVSNNENA